MREEILKPATVRVPVLLARGTGRGSQWQGWPDIGDDAARERLDVHAATETAARHQLTDLIATTLRRAVSRPILVIGGAPYYADCVHVINPEPYGWIVYVIRAGRQTSSWSSIHDADQLLPQVLDHVGGDPQVIKL